MVGSPSPSPAIIAATPNLSPAPPLSAARCFARAQLYVEHLIVNDDQAAVELLSLATAKSGMWFNNHYCWIVFFEDKKIVRVALILIRPWLPNCSKARIEGLSFHDPRGPAVVRLALAGARGRPLSHRKEWWAHKDSNLGPAD